MADRGVGSSLRRLCAPTGALVALCLALAVSATAATPSPDPPPQPAPPKAEPVQPTVTVVVRQAPVVTRAPVVQRPAPVAKAPAKRVKPKPGPAKVTRVVKPRASAPAPVVPPPHDRYGAPLAALAASPSPSVDSIDRDLLALAGFGLLLVALGGAVVLFAARRQLEGRLA
jgi:outer membrane biosynthesis protein TonB